MGVIWEFVSKLEICHVFPYQAMASTRITVSKESKKFWESFKNYPEESMINRILRRQKEEDEELLAENDIAKLKASVLEIEKGNHTTQEQMKEKYGL